MTDAECLLFVFAKPPVAGVAKTRMAPHVGTHEAAELARALLQDTWSMVESLDWLHPILATTEESSAFGLGHELEVWLQEDGDLGQRLERVLRRGLERAAAVIAIGADAPGLPRSAIEHARDALGHADAVLGPAEDGGFYLIGLRRCPKGLLHDLPWSAAVTLERTCEQLQRHGLSVATIEPWFDVDVPADLERLRTLLEAKSLHAPNTERVLRSWRYLRCE